MASNTAKKALSLSTPLQYLKGVGPMRAAAFARKGIVSLGDALYYFPRRYEDRQHLCTPRDLVTLTEGTQVTVLARIERLREIPLRGRGKTMRQCENKSVKFPPNYKVATAEAFSQGNFYSCTYLFFCN